MSTIRQYDVVRVLRLNPPRLRTASVETRPRGPRVGDIACVCHEYDPSDPNAPVAAEMVDEEGHTVWLADLERDELELVERPQATPRI